MTTAEFLQECRRRLVDAMGVRPGDIVVIVKGLGSGVRVKFKLPPITAEEAAAWGVPMPGNATAAAVAAAVAPAQQTQPESAPTAAERERVAALRRQAFGDETKNGT